jgi:hypothetical protein
MPVDPTPFNPLDRINLARSVERALLEQPRRQLPLEEVFNGAGLYAIYYHGPFELYRPISSRAGAAPIYVGKAVPRGSRRGLVDLGAAVGPVLRNRIAEHAESIEAANNLEVQHFSVRYLVVEDIFIAMAEALLIQQFRPLWNHVVSGFGLHDPGSGRHGSKRSGWDELHPGRPWHGKMRPAVTLQQLADRIEDAFASGDTATNNHLPYLP